MEKNLTNVYEYSIKEYVSSLSYEIWYYIRSVDDDECPLSFDDMRKYVKATFEAYEKIRFSFSEMNSLVYNDNQKDISELLKELEMIIYQNSNGKYNVGLYQASRQYGGAEEGGWYYTNWIHLEAKEMSYDEAMKYINQVDDENKDVYEHQGQQRARIELYSGQFEKTSTEHYS